MAATYTLRFPRSDAQGDYVLIQAASTGSQPLDLTIVGTDGEDPFAFSLRSNRISKYREKSGPCTEDEWESVLTAVLTDREAVEDIEVTARVQEKSQIEITFKKKIEQFSQRLGTLSLKFNPDQGIELFDWCSEAIGSREELKAQLASANSKAAKLENAVSELKDQLQGLINARGADEGDMLKGLQAIVNEKKVKIRQQQRLLASANVTTQEVAAPGPESEPETKPAKKGARGAKKPAPARAAGPSRRGKRKVEVSEDEDSDDGFEKMDMDTKEDVALDEDQVTTDAETASDTDDEDDDAPPPARQSNKNGTGHAKAAAANSEAPPSQNTRHKAEDKAPPPPRRLPFARGKPADDKASAGSETESDDEL